MHRWIGVLCVAGGVWLSGGAASAQAPFPGAVKLGDGWVPCTHPLAVAAGKGCLDPPVCEPKLIIVKEPGFFPGEEYAGLHSGYRMRVLAVVSDSQRRTVVVAEWIENSAWPEGIGQAFTFLAQEQGRYWQPVQGGGQ